MQGDCGIKRGLESRNSEGMGIFKCWSRKASRGETEDLAKIGHKDSKAKA